MAAPIQSGFLLPWIVLSMLIDHGFIYLFFSNRVRDWSCNCLLDLLSKTPKKVFISSKAIADFPRNTFIERHSGVNFKVGLTTLRDGEFKVGMYRSITADI